MHRQDGYPTRWPRDPAGWLSPTSLVAAWIAVDGGSLGGHIALVAGVDDSLLIAAAGRPASELAAVSRLFVDPTRRGRRLGQMLLNTVTEYAGEHELGLVLDVVDETRSAAIALYERLGWRLVGQRAAGWMTAAGVRPKLRLYVLPKNPSPLTLSPPGPGKATLN
ncbi:MAG: GNAT family N-acetyltransferase [Solirubrobacterales bacterium]|nr:GNAT family N-acetyltransferase [Solirubrobacterales bacterium]